MLAIIVPYYKLTFFRENLESLAAQTDQRFNVYIGNDASPENPEELLKEFEGKFNFTYRKFERNLGGTSLTKQWERCIDMMGEEEWFQILGDDDYLDLNFVAGFNHVYEKKLILEYKVIKCLSKIVDEKNKILLDRAEETRKLGESAIDSFIAKATGAINSSLSEHIFSTQKYRKVKFKEYPLAWHSDDFALLQFSDFDKIYILKEALCYIRMSKYNISGIPGNDREKNLAKKTFYYDLFENVNIEKLNSKQKKYLTEFWILKLLTRYNTNTLKLFVSNRGYLGGIKYLIFLMHNNIRKVEKAIRFWNII